MAGRQGNPPKLSYEDLLQVRELYAIGRTVFTGRPLPVKVIAEKFDVCYMTIWRAVTMDAVELEKRRGVKTRRG